MAVLLAAALLPFSTPLKFANAETPVLYVKNITVTQEALQAYNVTSFTINPTIHNVGDAIAVFVVSTSPLSSVTDTDSNPWWNAFGGYGTVYNAAAQLEAWVSDYPYGYISTVYTGIYSSLYVTNAVSTGSPVITVTMSANTSLIRYNFYEFASNATNVIGWPYASVVYPVWAHTNSTVKQTAWLNSGHQITLANTDAFFAGCISSGGYSYVGHNLTSTLTTASSMAAPQTFAANGGTGWPPSGELAGYRTNVGNASSESVSIGFQYWSSSGTQRIDLFGFGVETSTTSSGGGTTGLTLSYSPVPTYTGIPTTFRWAYTGSGTVSYVNITTGDGGLVHTTLSTGTHTYTSVPSTGRTATAGILVPLYEYPGTGGYLGNGIVDWQAVAAIKTANPEVPMTVIVNPASGPGSSQDANFVNGIAVLHAAGITVLGYTYTTWGARASADVEADMNAYVSMYAVDGVMLDEMGSTAGNASYYTTLTSYAHAAGLTPVFGNPGTAVSSALVGTVDNLVIYEGQGLPSASTLASRTSAGTASAFSFVSYGVPTLDVSTVSSLSAYVGYLYVTPYDYPNPYYLASTYLSSLVGAMSYSSSGYTANATAVFSDGSTLASNLLTVNVLQGTTPPPNGTTMQGLSLACVPTSLDGSTLTTTCTVTFAYPATLYYSLENVRFYWGTGGNTLVGQDSSDPSDIITSTINSPVTQSFTYASVNQTYDVWAKVRLSYLGVVDNYYETNHVMVTVGIPGGGGTPTSGSGSISDSMLSALIVIGAILVISFSSMIVIDTKVGKGKMSGTTLLAIFMGVFNVVVFAFIFYTPSATNSPMLPATFAIPMILVDILLAIALIKGGNGPVG